MKERGWIVNGKCEMKAEGKERFVKPKETFRKGGRELCGGIHSSSLWMNHVNSRTEGRKMGKRGFLTLKTPGPKQRKVHLLSYPKGIWGWFLRKLITGNKMIRVAFRKINLKLESLESEKATVKPR